MLDIFTKTNLNKALSVRMISFVLFGVLMLNMNALGQLVNLKQNANVHVSSGAVVQVNGSIDIDNADLTQSGGGEIRIKGDWTNRNGGSFTPGSGTVTFEGTENATIGGGTATTFNFLKIDKTGASDDSVYVEQNLSVNEKLLVSNGKFTVGPLNFTLTIYGDIENNDVIDFFTAGYIDLEFTGAENSIFYGTGSISDFHEININKASISDTVDIGPSNFSAIQDFLELNTGMVKFSNNYTITNRFFKDYTAPQITSRVGFWIDNPNLTVTGQAGNMIVEGVLHITRGEMNVGAASSGHLLYNIAVFTIEGGTLNVEQRLSRWGINSTVEYSQSGGQVNVGVGMGQNADRAMFDIGSTNSVFNWSDGTIEMRSDNENPLGSYYINTANGSVTGGMLNVKANEANDTYKIVSSMPVGGLTQFSQNDPVVLLGSDLEVLGDVTIDGDGADRFDADNYDMSIGGDFENNYSSVDGFNARDQRVTFDGSTDQGLGGSQQTNFYTLALQKTGGKLTLGNSIFVDEHLRLINNGILELDTNDLTVSDDSFIYSDNSSGFSFSDSKFISNSKDTTGGYLIKEIATTQPTPFLYRLPVGTDSLMTNMMVSFRSGGVTFNSDADFRVRPVSMEHPKVEKMDASLTKFWQIRTNNIDVNYQGVDFTFYYDQSEVKGSEGNYSIMKFYSNYWYVEPGTINSVSTTNNFFQSYLTPNNNIPLTGAIDGDWTAGEPEAARAVYYSLGGDFNDPDSWSKQSYGGAVSNSYPTKKTDIIYIGDGKTITLTANTDSVQSITIEETIGGKGKFLTKTYRVYGDSLKVMDGGMLGTSHVSGITNSDATGNIRTTVRGFSQNGVYIFDNQTQDQVSGDGLPDEVATFICDKGAGTRLTLSKNVNIRDSLYIVDGIIYVDQYTINGDAPGRKMYMDGGELQVITGFPSNYDPPAFSAGKITFTILSSPGPAITIPGSGSTPGVAQYHDLTIRGHRGYSDITFSSQGEIRINGALDISQLNFNTFNLGNTRMRTNGSTILFNGDDQNIPRNTLQTGGDPHQFRLYFDKLKIGGTGTKTIIDGDQRIFGEVILDSATFSAGNFDLDIRGDWTSNGGDFRANDRTVYFNSTQPDDTNRIKAFGNEFNNVIVQGVGVVKHYSAADDTLKVRGDWTINGTFNPGNETIEFTGTAQQTLYFDTKITFNNVVVNNTGSNSDAIELLDNNETIEILNDLNFESGNIWARSNRQVIVWGEAYRNGTGFVDGNLSINIPKDSTGYILYPLGHYDGVNDEYTPVEINLTSSGGAGGLLNIRTDDTHPGGGVGITPIDRSYYVKIPNGSSFDRGSRLYNIIMHFVASDVIGNPSDYVIKRNLSSWEFLSLGTRTSTSAEAINVDQFNSIGNEAIFCVGPPAAIVYYSIADDEWDNPNTWSLEGYGGNPAPDYPHEGDSVRIGDGYTVTMNTDYIISNGNAVVVETAGPTNRPGHLNFATHILDGPGNFVLKDGGILTMGLAGGIMAVGNSGNVQISDAERDFNYNNHNNGHFIYTTAAGQITGTGLPDTVATLTINNSGNTVTLSNDVAVKDSLHIQNGTFDVDATNNRSIYMLGDWRNAGTFVERNGTVEFSGADHSKIYNSSGETFYDLEISKTSNSVTLMDGDITIDHQLTFNSGYIDSRSNDRAVIIPINSTISRTSGHVDGEMRRYFNNTTAGQNFKFVIGAGVDYTPSTIELDGTPSTAGYIGSIVQPEVHPDIDNSGLFSGKSVSRYWELEPYSGFNLGGIDFDLILQFLNPDDIRGGADTDNFEMRQYTTSWSAPGIGQRTDTTTEGLNISVLSGDYVIGDSTAGKTYYSKNSGIWSDPDNWALNGYNGTGDGTYPSEYDDYDIVYIGNGKRIEMDSAYSVAGVTVEDAGGQGTLAFRENLLTGLQFVLKSGGHIEIGDSDGITDTADAGNVRTSIRNYNHNNHNNGYFTYTDAADVTGDGLPSNIAYLNVDVNSPVTTDLTQDVNVSKTITINGGTFVSNQKNIWLAGLWENNASFDHDINSTVTLNGSSDQNITGSSETEFEYLKLEKSGGDVILGANISALQNLDFSSDVLVKLNGNDLTIGPNGTITSTTTLDSLRMVQFDGTASGGHLIKYHNNGAGSRAFTYPVGIGADYNPAMIDITGSHSSASTSVQLRQGPHPEFIGTNTLKKFWTVDITGISSITDSDVELHYLDSDVNGDQSDYIPAVYTASGWEVNLGTTRDATTSPINVEGETVTFDGDWTAGEPGDIFPGRIYYSIVPSGDWDIPASWSNVSHFGPPAVYYPGFFPEDTVYISENDDITYNMRDISISSMTIGWSNDGDLLFEKSSPWPKSLTVEGDVYIDTEGAVDTDGIGGSTVWDTLVVWGDLHNYASGEDVVRFITSDPQAKVMLKFAGPGSSQIIGEGNYNAYSLEIAKTEGLNSFVYNRSESFTASLGNSVNDEDGDPDLFKITSGVYVHDNPEFAELDDTGDGDFRMGTNSGLIMEQGHVEFEDDFITNNNTLIEINGGTLDIGNGNNDHFYYNSGTIFRQTGGTMNVRASFSRFEDASTIGFELTGGNLNVVISENEVGNIGFDVSNPTSTFTQTSGTITIVDISYSQDYQVNAGTVNVTGGTLQIGRAGDPFRFTAGDIGVGNELPTIWDLVIRYTRNASNGLRALIVKSNPLYVINDVIIYNDDACLDLNTNSLSLGGHFINRGKFDTDGAWWESGVGSKNVHFVGDSAYGRIDQMLLIEDPVVSAIDHAGGYRNEPFYNVIIDKPDGGKVYLDSENYSNMVVRNQLSFTSDNKGIIDSRANNKFVFMDKQDYGGNTPPNDNANIMRTGLGHVDGHLKRDIDPNAGSYFYPVGYSTTYTPAWIDFAGIGGLRQPLDVITGIGYPPDPPAELGGAGLDSLTLVMRWWNIGELNGGAFQMDGRNFDLITQYLNPEDVRPGASWANFKHFRVDPDPDQVPTEGTVTDTTVQSLNNSAVNDVFYVIANELGQNFFSRKNGDWTDLDVWSTEDYGGPPITNPPFYPQEVTHEAFIGNSNTITLNEAYINVRSVNVQNEADGPGALLTEDNFIDGLNFTLEDSCYFGTKNRDGIRQSANSGAILTDSRNFGIAHYLYYSDAEDQRCGDGLIGDILSLYIDNHTYTTTLNAPINIFHNLTIDTCIFDAGNRNIDLHGNFIITDQASFIPTTAQVSFIGDKGQEMRLSDPRGVDFYSLAINKPSSTVTISGDAADAYAHVSHRLYFGDGNQAVINSRKYNRKLIMGDNGEVLRIGGTPYGHVDGILQKQASAAGDSIFFEVGFGFDYAPAYVALDSLAGNGTAGSIDGANNSPIPNDPDNGPFYGNRMDTLSQLPRWWSLQPRNGFDMGARVADVGLGIPSAELSLIDTSRSVIRRRDPDSTADPLWTERAHEDGDVEFISSAFVTAHLTPSATKWEGLGEFYVGPKLNRTFYSRQNGDWTDPETWSYIRLGGPNIPPYGYPNDLPNENEDNVIVGLDHHVIMTSATKDPVLDTLIIQDHSTLDFNDNTIGCHRCNLKSKGVFSLVDTASIRIDGTNNPTDAVIYTFTVYDYDPVRSEFTTIDFKGAQTITPAPWGYPEYYGNVRISENGTKYVAAPVLIRGNLFIDNDATLENAVGVNALEVKKSVINDAFLLNNGIIEIGE